ncbi:MAG: hypothetical protein DYH13_10345 [Alphaproteobacteria bacterium PRO2]|nr:hypothetical protein [Alphaproteobacteria bacterium PRO2]
MRRPSAIIYKEAWLPRALLLVPDPRLRGGDSFQDFQTDIIPQFLSKDIRGEISFFRGMVQG